MAHDGPTEELLRRLLTAVSSRASVDPLINQARTQAEEEVRTLLKSAFKAAMLRQVVDQLEGGVEQPEDQVPAPASVPDLTPAIIPAIAGDTACYLYAITPATAAASISAGTAIDPAFPIEILESDGIQAIASRVSIAEFGQAALNDRVSDAQWVEAKVRAHDEVVKSAMSFGAVIPCRFCTIVRSRDDVQTLLKVHRQRIASALASLAGKSEWGVKLSHSPRPAVNEAPANVSGKAYLQQKQHAQDRRREIERADRQRAMELHETLAAAASDATQLPIRRRAEESAELLLNGAYLVADADIERFHAVITDWSDRYAADGWRAELTGPWPPYNFADLDLSLEAAA